MRRNRDTFDIFEEEFQRKLEKIFGDAVQEITDRVTFKALVSALRMGDVEAALRLLGIDETDFEGLHFAVEDLFRRAGSEFSNDVPVFRDPDTKALIKFSFSARNPRAERIISEQSSKLVREVAEGQRELVRQNLTRSLSLGVNPRTAALELVGRTNRATGKRQGGVLGLTATQEQHVANYLEQLRSSDAAEFKKALKRGLRDKRFDRTIAKAIRTGEPIPAAMIDKMVTAYKRRYLKYRGEAIGRSETMKALGTSQRETWQQAINKGQVAEERITRIPDATRDNKTRPTHTIAAEMNKEGVGWNEPFQTPMGPKMHCPYEDEVMCRCRERIKVDYIGAAERRLKRKTKPKPKPVEFEVRTPFEKAYLGSLDSEAHPDFIKAFNATAPVGWGSSRGGAYYRPSTHSIHMVKSWRNSKRGKSLVGVFAHEYGHAIDEYKAARPRSGALLPAMREDLDRIRGGKGSVTLPDGEKRERLDAYLAKMYGVDGNQQAQNFLQKIQQGDFSGALRDLDRALYYNARNGSISADDGSFWRGAVLNMNDFLGSLTNLEYGHGHTAKYYAQFPYLGNDNQGNRITDGNVAEIFANGYFAHVSEGRELWEFLIEAMAPKTTHAIRKITKDIANGS
ncbi:hypothetical protein [Pseudovibrio sp. POLY-S9]|uniref:hypothetical protein n=1 Tax=Pseudovibrio sp. POLY-S9 TaxID=1576596 RepID=UPI000710E2D1|nr:hypothetical protein [Pseudovibrio sp. POLY-S9]